ncbi:uncharacterized protein PAN0_013c4601 [Moesziomyces antarcticus]|uniref:Uncharacterized protein n=2 Tax=Pseudozyma antarctica TaxID=84753 RepID=A0A081CI83_PSEA2|nr:uncharacterized protein PAN0_013c4601 [Moesziomyces antarcticus]GAK66379.1 hypothetical protein PAN0_013c4601 [Moesziomyces antarcticus]SPO47419.1 uncharacterized protein PSANT_05107 [Moesziomyces antarcticus]
MHDLFDAAEAACELLPVVAAARIHVGRHLGSALLVQMSVWFVARALASLTAHFPPPRRSLDAHTHAAAEEPQQVSEGMGSEARRLGIATPRLDAVRNRLPMPVPGSLKAALETSAPIDAWRNSS